MASRARAMIPAAMGADTEVPVWPSVQRCRRSVVTWRGAAEAASAPRVSRAPSWPWPWPGQVPADKPRRPGSHHSHCAH